ncbi:MAG: RNA polymerase sigma factor [Pirellulales bacterium]
MTVDLSDRRDEELAGEAAREGADGPALAELVRRHRDRVWRICYRLMGNEDDASDAAQEVFVRLFFHRDKFAGRSLYTTWVHGIAVRTCLGSRRSRGRRQQRIGLFGDNPLAEQAAKTPAEGDSLDLEMMLDTLEEEDRAILILKYSEGYEYEELAEMFELSPSACKMRVSRARDKIKQRFGG